MSRDIDGLIAEVNRGLERVKVRRNGNYLVLRGTFPPKPGSGHVQAKQYDISPGMSATAAGLKATKAVALEIDGQLQQGKFSWERWLKQKDGAVGVDATAERQSAQLSVAEWIERFKQHYLTHTRSGDPEGNWHRSYWLYLIKLPQGERLSYKLLERYILDSPYQSATRRERAEVAAALWAFAGAEIDGAKCRYSGDLRSMGKGHKEKPLQIPSDEEILAVQKLITNPAWLWVYRMMATYGLRNHEVFRLDTSRVREEPGILKVLEDTKTGYRLVYPCPARWWLEWQLWQVELPRVDLKRTNLSLGSQVGVQFKRYGVPFIPYSLRHAYAVRTAVVGVDSTIAAKWMGHSLNIHYKTYHQWINEGSFTLAWERMRMNEENYLRRLERDDEEGGGPVDEME